MGQLRRVRKDKKLVIAGKLGKRSGIIRKTFKVHKIMKKSFFISLYYSRELSK